MNGFVKRLAFLQSPTKKVDTQEPNVQPRNFSLSPSQATTTNADAQEREGPPSSNLSNEDPHAIDLLHEKQSSSGRLSNNSKSSRVTSICTGDLCVAAIAENGDLHLWSDRPHSSPDQSHPFSMTEVPQLVGTLRHCVSQVGIGSDHICALTSDMKLFSWGAGECGQLGHGDKNNRVNPTLINTLDKLRIRKVACGRSFTICATESGALYTWGAAAHGQLGHGDRLRRTQPTRIEELNGLSFEAISCGDKHACVVTSEGYVITWGCPENGRLGRGPDKNPSPSAVDTITQNIGRWGKPIDVSCGVDYTAVITDTGKVLTWGRGDGGQLGLDSTTSQEVPCQVGIFGEGDVRAHRISCGSQCTAVCTGNGEIYAWGSPRVLDLTEVAESAMTPIKLSLYTPESEIKYKAVSAAHSHISALSEEGIIYNYASMIAGDSELANDSEDDESEENKPQMLKEPPEDKPQTLKEPPTSIAPTPTPSRLAVFCDVSQNELDIYRKNIVPLLRLVRLFDTRALTHQAKAFRKWTTLSLQKGFTEMVSSERPQKAESSLLRISRIFKHYSKDKKQHAFRHWSRASQSEKHTREMEKVQANLKEVHEKASEYDAQLNALETKTAHFSVRNGFDKLAATIRGKIPWSKKRGFDLWKNFVMVKRSESDLRRATMRVQVATNRLNFERAGMDETEQSVRRARTEGAVLLMFYRWRSHVDRVIRAEEANTFASERERLVKSLNKMRDLMTQSFRAEKKAFATALVQGERFDVKVRLAHDKLQEYCTDISSVAKATGALTEGQTMENITPTKSSTNLT